MILPVCPGYVRVPLHAEFCCPSRGCNLGWRMLEGCVEGGCWMKDLKGSWKWHQLGVKSLKLVTVVFWRTVASVRQNMHHACHHPFVLFSNVAVHMTKVSPHQTHQTVWGGKTGSFGSGLRTYSRLASLARGGLALSCLSLRICCECLKVGTYWI